MSEAQEFKFKLEISSKGNSGIRHILAVTLLLLVLFGSIASIAYVLYLFYHP